MQAELAAFSKDRSTPHSNLKNPRSLPKRVRTAIHRTPVTHTAVAVRPQAAIRIRIAAVPAAMRTTN